jgi:hypothetical protein
MVLMIDGTGTGTTLVVDSQYDNTTVSGGVGMVRTAAVICNRLSLYALRACNSNV